MPLLTYLSTYSLQTLKAFGPQSSPRGRTTLRNNMTTRTETSCFVEESVVHDLEKYDRDLSRFETKLRWWISSTHKERDNVLLEVAHIVRNRNHALCEIHMILNNINK